ncbi:hypothetical protein D9619_009626 [Psilocybe cf. subviscida]|uniref:SHSP domain-containing protein n=1 Tax=Psilocybe cf. subviscida TaxID=2480587 RepID=A0A8H5BMV5_9AGAR|nr:hypothetical protein D9619_009626 [Psilocybe cf. subviscida]
MSPTRTSKSPSPASPLSDLVSRQIYEQFGDPAFLAAVNRAANIKCLMAIQAGRLRVASPYKLPEPIRYIPRMDLVDDPSSSYYSAVFEIPGINKDSISLGIRSGKLFITGRRHAPYFKPARLEAATPNATQSDLDRPASDATQRALRLPVRELRYGNFERSVDIPAGIKESEIKAILMDGLLTVTWPKASHNTVATAPRISPAKSKSSSPSNHPQTLVAAGPAAQ